MTRLYSNDFEALAPGAIPTGWTTIQGSDLIAYTNNPAAGTKCLQGANDGDAALYTTPSAIADQALRIDTKLVDQGAGVYHHAQLIVRGSVTPAYYMCTPVISGGNLSVQMYKYSGGYTLLGTSGTLLTVSNGDILHHEFRAVGTTLSCYVWKNSNSKPGSASYSLTDASIASGKPGIRMGKTGYSYTAGADNLVWTDAAGGEDYFDAAPAANVTMSGPSTGAVGVASTNFTVGADGAITGTVVVTPSDGGGGGTFTPTTVSISSGSPTGTFTYTPASSGAKTISVTNNGSLGNPSNITYTATGGDIAPPAYARLNRMGFTIYGNRR